MRSITTRHHCSITTLLFFTILSLFTSKFASSLDTLTATQSLVNGQTLISERQSFELGFFTPGNSRNWYVGIWYKSIPRTYVWVANRDNPLTNSSGTFKISNQSIVLYDREENLTWSSNRTSARNPVMQLLDSGNLVLRDQDSDSSQFLWQSFDYPTDTLLPDMKFGWDLNTGLDRYLSSWKSSDDPGTGDFSFKLQYHGFPEAFLSKDKKIQYRSGPWNGQRFSGVPEMEPVDHISFSFITNQDEVYYSFHTSNKSLYSRLTVTSSGFLQRFAWIPETQQWSKFWYAPKDQCDDYRECGPLQVHAGVSAKNVQAWSLRDGSGGCARRTELNCLKDKFLHMKNMKLPESATTYVDRNTTLKDCEVMCSRNCSCTAYANSNISNGGSGCVFWTGVLFDMRQYPEGGQDLYVRLAASDIGDGGGADTIIIGIAVGISILILALSGFSIWKRKRLLSVCNGNTQQRGPQDRSQDFLLNGVIISRKDFTGEKSTDEFELPLFEFSTIASATNNFADENKLGEGGFGRVHKVWRKWKDGKGLEVLDSSVGSSYSPCEVLRCIHVGLLCVQERAEDRPTMSSAVLMLSSETATMPHPKTPGYCLGRSPFETDSSSSKQDESFSVNHVTVTVLDASPGSSSNTYLGIWYHEVPEKTVVWVANRNDPIIGSSGFIFINQYGNLVLYGHDDQKFPVWSTNVSVEENDSCEAQLLDSGNLIIVTKRSRGIIWQSFDHPTNTLLPGMKLGLDRKLGHRLLTSWRSADDPGIGDFSGRINLNGLPQFFFYNGKNPITRSLPWPRGSEMGLFKSTFVNNQDKIFWVYTVTDDSYLLRIIVDHSGHAKALSWRQSDGQWKDYWKIPQFQCDYYGHCGAYSKCEYADPSEFVCACLPGFEPKYPEQWSARDGSGGCVRKRLQTSSVCHHVEGFVKIENYCLPDTSNAAWVDMGKSRADCELECKRNCSCSAYSIIEIPGKGDACLTWYKELVDIRYERRASYDLYVWELWGQEKALEIVDPSLKELYHPREALKCIRIGLLCVEEDAMNRPSMLAVVFMLSNETEIPSPKQPAFLFRESRNNPDIALAVEDGVCSVNQVTISEIASR
uniref:non-specific serine/threonine protein kinase n=1 Tax=Salix viminalis TaxID=40686 RepID=A0A6N2LN26_SALVM